MGAPVSEPLKLPATAQGERLAQQLVAWRQLVDHKGRRVRLARDVSRQPYFVAKKGATGVVVAPFLDGPDLVAAIKLDHPPSGAEQFEGEIHWKQGVNLLEDFEKDVELL